MLFIFQTFLVSTKLYCRNSSCACFSRNRGRHFGIIHHIYIVHVAHEDDTFNEYYYIDVQFFKTLRIQNLQHFKNHKILAIPRRERRRFEILNLECIKYKCIFFSCTHFDDICRRKVYLCTRLMNHISEMQNIDWT